MKRILSILALVVLWTVPGYSQYYGDIVTGSTHDFKFTTRDDTGAPTTLTSGAVKCYKGNATGTEVTTGVTLTADFDSITGLNNLRVDASDAFYAAGSDISCLLTAGTVDSVSVVGEVVVQFSVDNRSTATLNAKMGGFTGSGVNTVLGFFKALAKKDASNPSDMGGTFDAATDSLEATVDNAPTVADVADGVHEHVVEGSYTFEEVVRIMAAVLAGESTSGAGRRQYVGLDGTTERVDTAVSAGDRSDVMLDAAP